MRAGSGGRIWSIEIYLLPHYVAPFTAAFYAIGLQAMRHLRVWKPEGKPVGSGLVRFIVFLCVVLAGLRLFAQPLHLAPPEWPPSNWNFDLVWARSISAWSGPRLKRSSSNCPGGNWRSCATASDHNPLDEWVYNRC